jgi:endogenous inhibitor of DNA gyrase (YacG/DUF329 family)
MIRTSCPICERVMEGQSPKEWPQLPFCSERCKTIDLGRWLNESYRLPVEEGDDAVQSEETGIP